MRGNSDKQTRSFTTGQTTSPRKRGARDNRPLDNTHRSLSYQKTTGQDKRWNSRLRKTNPKHGSTIQHNLTLLVINIGSFLLIYIKRFAEATCRENYSFKLK